MTTPLGLAAAALLLSAGGPQESGRDLRIRVLKDNWGNASLADIRAVLLSSAGEIRRHVPDRSFEPIHVSRSRKSPIVLYTRGPNREYRVKLNVEGSYWAQFAFQFAHEFCHILARYDEDNDPNEWFEETLCETASLFALRRMAETWKASPPYPNWKGYARNLKKYADERVRSHALPEGATVARFYRDNLEGFKKSNTDRKLNGVIAVQLLPLFEESPESWGAVGWINAAGGKDRTFDDYLRDWHRKAPERHRAFIVRIAGLFDVKIR